MSDPEIRTTPQIHLTEYLQALGGNREATSILAGINYSKPFVLKIDRDPVEKVFIGDPSVIEVRLDDSEMPSYYIVNYPISGDSWKQLFNDNRDAVSSQLHTCATVVQEYLTTHGEGKPAFAIYTNSIRDNRNAPNIANASRTANKAFQGVEEGNIKDVYWVLQTRDKQESNFMMGFLKPMAIGIMRRAGFSIVENIERALVSANDSFLKLTAKR
jgi:hypothetical protein